MILNLALLTFRVNPPHTLSGNPDFQGTQPNGCGTCAYLMPSDQQKNLLNPAPRFLFMTSMSKRAGFYTRKGVVGQCLCGVEQK